MTTPVFTWPWIGPTHPAFGAAVDKGPQRDPARAVLDARRLRGGQVPLDPRAERRRAAPAGRRHGRRADAAPAAGALGQPKTILFTLYALMTAVFGSQESYTVDDRRPWRIYEFTNEIVIELPFALIGASNENASFLHGFGVRVRDRRSANTFTAKG